MKRDFDAMISKGSYSFNAMLGPERPGPVTILAVASEDEPDLALVKAAGDPYRGIKLAASTIVGPDLVGTEVFSFGYPLGSELEVLFQERTVKLTGARFRPFGELN